MPEQRQPWASLQRGPEAEINLACVKLGPLDHPIRHPPRACGWGLVLSLCPRSEGHSVSSSITPTPLPTVIAWWCVRGEVRQREVTAGNNTSDSDAPPTPLSDASFPHHPGGQSGGLDQNENQQGPPVRVKRPVFFLSALCVHMFLMTLVLGFIDPNRSDGTLRDVNFPAKFRS